MLALFIIAALATPAPVPDTSPPPTAKRVLGMIRAKFRSHRPPPPYEIYTIERKQNTVQGYPDYANSYTEKVWVRTLDDAALQRRVYRSINRGQMTFNRPAFNEDRDPGPPTADVFQPAPIHSRPVTDVPTPEPVGTALPLLGTVQAVGEFDYRITAMATEGDLVHLSIVPTRDPDRNRLREIYADKSSYELKRLVATDKLFIDGTHDIYGVTFDITVGMLDGTPIVTDIRGTVGDGYADDGQVVNYAFRNISFPATLPAWYFDTRAYATHGDDAPI